MLCFSRIFRIQLDTNYLVRGKTIDPVVQDAPSSTPYINQDITRTDEPSKHLVENPIIGVIESVGSATFVNLRLLATTKHCAIAKVSKHVTDSPFQITQKH